MKSTHCSALAAAVFIVAALQTMPAQAQTRVFVAAHGSDSNPCTFALPCRTFQHAHDVVVANGEIDVLDPAGYGALNITKSISIQGHGFSGISVASGGTGITVNAATTDKIHLNGLLIDGAGTGLKGIELDLAAMLTVVDCQVRNFTGDGILLRVGRFLIANTLVSDNGGNGVNVSPLFIGNVTGNLDKVTTSHNTQNGVLLTAGSNQFIFATVTDSMAAYNGTNGYSATSTVSTGDIAELVLDNVTMVANGVAGAATSSPAASNLARVVIGHSRADNTNQAGSLACNGGVISSYGDNRMPSSTNCAVPQTVSLH